MRFTAQCLGVIISIVAASSASGEESCTINTLSGRGSTDSANANFECLSARLEELSQQNQILTEKLDNLQMTRGQAGEQGPPGIQGATGQPGSDATAPKGAILAFDRPQGCPLGWTDMGQQWRGRSLVAAATDANDIYGFGRMGGAESHILTINEMPAHAHSFTGRDFSRGGWGGQGVLDFAVGGSQRVSSLAPIGTIGETGRGRAHNNMPPYIALFFCKWD